MKKSVTALGFLFLLTLFVASCTPDDVNEQLEIQKKPSNQTDTGDTSDGSGIPNGLTGKKHDTKTGDTSDGSGIPSTDKNHGTDTGDTSDGSGIPRHYRHASKNKILNTGDTSDGSSIPQTGKNQNVNTGDTSDGSGIPSEK